MKKYSAIIVICMLYGMAITSCTENVQEHTQDIREELPQQSMSSEISETESTAVFEVSSEQYTDESKEEKEDKEEAYREEAEETYQAYLDSYVQGREEDYYAADIPGVQGQLRTEERGNIIFAKVGKLTEVPFDEDAYREYVKETYKAESDGYEKIQAYLVELYLDVKKNTKASYTGPNYKYCVMGRRNGEWKLLPTYPEGNDTIRDYIMQIYGRSTEDADKKYLNIAFINYADSPIYVDKYGHVVEGTEEEIKELNEWLQKEYEYYGIDGYIPKGSSAAQCMEEVEQMYRLYLERYMRDVREIKEMFYIWEQKTDEWWEEEVGKDTREERERTLSQEFYNLIELPFDEEEYREISKWHDRDLEEYDMIRLYLIGVDVQLNGITSSLYSGAYNGVNYDHKIVGRKNGEWKFLPGYTNGSAYIRDYIMKAYNKSEDEEVRRYLNIAFINYIISPVCVDGSGNVVEGTTEDMENMNRCLKEIEYKYYGVQDGLMIDIEKKKVY